MCYNHGRLSVGGALKEYGIPDFAPNCDDNEKLYAFMLHSDLYYRFREAARTPKTISELHRELKISKQELIDFVAACTQAEKGNTSLIKARYHFFVRALEGAYITLDEPRQLYLRRREHSAESQRVFEISVCQDCGRIAIVGKVDNAGVLQQVARKTERDPKECDYYLLWDSSISGEISSDDEDDMDNAHQTEEQGKDDFVICPKCGQIDTKANLRFEPICGCENVTYIVVLSMKPEGRSVIQADTRIAGRYRLSSKPEDNAILFTTVRKFKGLEAEVIICVDIDQDTFSSPEERSVFYVGTSRAMAYLDLLTLSSPEELATAIVGEAYSKHPQAIKAVRDQLKVKIASASDLKDRTES